MENVYFEFKGAYVETDNEIKIYLERQGVSQTKNCAHPLFYVEIGPHYGRAKWFAEVHYANNSNYTPNNQGQKYQQDYSLGSELAALQWAEQQIWALTKKPVKIMEQTIHYCHSNKTSYKYENDDLFLAPVFYEETTDTIRHYPSNCCLVVFHDGLFEKAVTEIDKAANKYLPQITKALSTGFHECDKKHGNDHCKRRLAWLIGEYIKRDHNEGRAIWCNLNMTARNREI